MVLWFIIYNGKVNENFYIILFNDIVFNNREICFVLISLMLILVLLFYKGFCGVKGSMGNSGFDGLKVCIM